jgi:hypothetical protein
MLLQYEKIKTIVCASGACFDSREGLSLHVTVGVLGLLLFFQKAPRHQTYHDSAQ